MRIVVTSLVIVMNVTHAPQSKKLGCRLTPPNDKVQLPGWPERLKNLESRHAGSVGCNGCLGRLSLPDQIPGICVGVLIEPKPFSFQLLSESCQPQ